MQGMSHIKSDATDASRYSNWERKREKTYLAVNTNQGCTLTYLGCTAGASKLKKK